jgi:hypothetical protein
MTAGAGWQQRADGGVFNASFSSSSSVPGRWMIQT